MTLKIQLPEYKKPQNTENKQKYLQNSQKETLIIH